MQNLENLHFISKKLAHIKKKQYLCIVIKKNILLTIKIKITIMKKIYLLQVLLKEKQDLCNYSYYENYKIAQDVAEKLRTDKLINPEYVRVIEVKFDF